MSYLKKMPQSTYRQYQRNIRLYVQKFNQTPFWYQTVAQQMSNAIFNNSYYLVQIDNRWEPLIHVKNNRYCLRKKQNTCGELKKMTTNIIKIICITVR